MNDRNKPKYGILTSKSVVRFEDEVVVEQVDCFEGLPWEEMHKVDHYLAEKYGLECPGCDDSDG